MLSLLIFFPLIAALVTVFSGEHAKKVALVASVAEFAFSLCFFFRFDPAAGIQFVENYSWIANAYNVPCTVDHSLVIQSYLQVSGIVLRTYTNNAICFGRCFLCIRWIFVLRFLGTCPHSNLSDLPYVWR